eukprot:m.17751 g.17751  ORF g.17751 m.17751 type:complete len:58 (+) comp10697_c0_seq8:94-267(+)
MVSSSDIFKVVMQSVLQQLKSFANVPLKKQTAEIVECYGSGVAGPMQFTLIVDGIKS